MHDEILNEFEEYLSGDPVSRSFTQHMEVCSHCAHEVAQMRDFSNEISLAFRAPELAGDFEPVHPPLGFYAKVARTIEAEQRSPLWGVFAPDLQFFRKIAFASLMVLAMLGGYLVSREAEFSVAEQATLTEHNSTVAHESPSDRQHIMVTLAAYEH